MKIDQVNTLVEIGMMIDIVGILTIFIVKVMKTDIDVLIEEVEVEAKNIAGNILLEIVVGNILLEIVVEIAVEIVVENVNVLIGTVVENAEDIKVINIVEVKVKMDIDMKKKNCNIRVEVKVEKEMIQVNDDVILRKSLLQKYLQNSLVLLPHQIKILT